MSEFRYLTGRVVPIADRDVLDRIPRHHLPRCFGCGPENPDRLGVEVDFEGDKAVATIRFAPRFEGGPGLVHGGAVAAFFDDLIGFVPFAHQKPAVTAKLDVNYLQPVPLGWEMRGEAWLSSIEGRKLWAEAAGYGPDGSVMVEVGALFVQVGAEHFTRALQRAYRPDEYYP